MVGTIFPCSGSLKGYHQLDKGHDRTKRHGLGCVMNCHGRWEDRDDYSKDEYISMSSVHRVHGQWWAPWRNYETWQTWLQLHEMVSCASMHNNHVSGISSKSAMRLVVRLCETTRKLKVIVLFKFDYLNEVQWVFHRLKYFNGEQTVKLKIMQNESEKQNREHKCNGMIFSVLK